jgi:aminoglycoside phosphotransferase (APT) family kinase protein
MSGAAPDAEPVALAAATRAWIERSVGEGAQVVSAARLIGGWTSDMRLVRVRAADAERLLVLRSFSKPFFLRHAEGLLSREARVLAQLDGEAIPVARVIAVDARGEHCAYPSLLRTHLAGAIRLEDDGAAERSALLAEMLVKIHRFAVPAEARPRNYQIWTPPQFVRAPEATAQPDLWARAIEIARRPTPPHESCFLHRDYHPGNVLFAHGESPRITGVVDWVETSWGPADLDVAHCSTALALLHGPEFGLRFADLYRDAGGVLAADAATRLHFYLLDALHYAPDPEKLATPWREAGRTDLAPELLAERIERYVQMLLERLA